MATVKKSNTKSNTQSKVKGKARAKRAPKSQGNSSLGYIVAGAIGATLGWLA